MPSHRFTAAELEEKHLIVICDCGATLLFQPEHKMFDDSDTVGDGFDRPRALTSDRGWMQRNGYLFFEPLTCAVCGLYWKTENTMGGDVWAVASRSL